MSHSPPRAPRTLTMVVLLGIVALLGSLLPGGRAAAAEPARLRIVNQIERFDYFFCFDQPEESDTCNDFYVNGNKVASLDYRYFEPYITLPAGSVQLQMVRYGASPAQGTLAQLKTYLEAGKSYTAVARGLDPSGFTMIRDRIPTIDSSQVAIKFANFATSLPGVDVYIDGQRVLRGLTYRAHSAYFRLPSGDHTIAVAPTGSQELKEIITPEFPLQAGSVTTAFISGYPESERVAFGAMLARDN